MTQKDAVLNYIKENGSITPIDAFYHLGVTKLATVVSGMIRHDGMKIRKTPVKIMTRYGHETTFMRYSLED